MKNGILEEYLNMKTREINSMLVAEYDPELHMQVMLEDAREEGILQGINQGINQGIINMARIMKTNGYSFKEIQKISGLSKEEIESL